MFYDGEPFDDFGFDVDIEASRQRLLEDVLYQLTVAELRQIARRRVWTIKGTRKDDIVAQVATQMLASLNDPKMLSDLTRDERELLNATYTLFGLMLPIHPEQFEYVWRDVLKRHGSAEPVVTGLVSYGLFLRIDEEWESDYVYYRPLLPIPELLLSPLPLVSPQYQRSAQRPVVPAFPAPSFINQIERVGYYAAAGGYMAAAERVGQFYPEGHDLPWIGNWPYLEEEESKVARTNYYRLMSEPVLLTVPLRPHLVSEQTYHALRDVVNSWETLDWIVLFLIQERILQMDEDRKLIFNAQAWQDFLELSEQMRLLILFSGWYDGFPEVFEMRYFLAENPDLSVWRLAHPDLRYDSFIGEFIFARQIILRFLRGLAEDPKKSGQWYSLSEFAAEVLSYRPDLYHLFTSEETWGLKRDDYLISLEEPHVWERAVLTMIQSLFVGPLYWMNMIDVFVQNKQVEAFRLTDVGCFLLSPSKNAQPTESDLPGNAEWIDGHTLKLIPGRDMNALMGLVSRVAIPVSGQPFTYRLGGPGLESSFADGETPQSLANQFGQLGYALPDEAEKYLAQIYERFGRVHLYDELTIVEFSDDTAVVELRAAGLLDDVLLYEFSPRLIVIDPDKVEQFAARLEAKGYMPKLTDGAAI